MAKDHHYRLLDSGGGRKLEQVGAWRLIRPASQAVWQPRLDSAEWKKADAVFTRDSAQHGTWSGRGKLPTEWDVSFDGMQMICRTTEFGHLGFFAEQLKNWNRLANFPLENCKVLNLFAYTGLASRAAARGGAEVVHVDASKTTVAWGAESQKKFEPELHIRWIIDDVCKFVQREVRRGHKYHGLILDPPTYGRGPKGQVWKIETDLVALLQDLQKIMHEDFKFMLVSCHSPGFTPITLENLLQPFLNKLGAGYQLKSSEMLIPEKGSSRSLPSGIQCFLQKEHL